MRSQEDVDFLVSIFQICFLELSVPSTLYGDKFIGNAGSHKRFVQAHGLLVGHDRIGVAVNAENRR
jgi:hypothetical protein